MVVDTSALIAYMFDEPSAERIEAALLSAQRLLISAATLVEASIVANRRYEGVGAQSLDIVLHRLQVEVVPVTLEQAELARAAYHQFGKGRHPARLNYGDCFSYALARAVGEPLLFIGNDFGRTDVEVVTY
jgi:ribonuclease VapC